MRTGLIKYSCISSVYFPNIARVGQYSFCDWGLVSRSVIGSMSLTSTIFKPATSWSKLFVILAPSDVSSKTNDLLRPVFSNSHATINA